LTDHPLLQIPIKKSAKTSVDPTREVLDNAYWIPEPANDIADKTSIKESIGFLS